jgi:hypothetical protein
MREDFSEEVKQTSAKRVGNCCSNPECRALTSGPQLNSGKAVNVGVAAHITAASPGGPRYDLTLSSEQRRDADNAIWLCQTCAKLVDNDPNRFTETLLRRWKEEAEDEALARIGKTATQTLFAQLRIELPPPVNPVGYESGGRYISTWNVKVRFIAAEWPLDILEIGLSEAEVGEWRIDEIFRGNSGRVSFPIRVDPSAEVWIRARSPKAFDTKPTVIGTLTFRFRDHTQPPGEYHLYPITEPPLKPTP